jgi:dethiobiotin synthetase
LRGVFVTGTDTGVGKSVLAAAVCAALAARGDRVAAFKPAVTGLDDDPGDWGHDHELLASAAGTGQSPEDVSPYRFGPAASPHLAAEAAGIEIDPGRLFDAADRTASAVDALVVEGVGGLMVPLTPTYLVRDFAADLGLPILIAARTGLGTINHTVLTVEAAREAGLRIAAVVMTPWPAEPSPVEMSNLRTVEALTAEATTGLPLATPEELAIAGRDLPLEEWLDQAPRTVGYATASPRWPG